MSNSSICANCGNEISQNFCPNCGQKKYKRIDGNYIKDEIQYTILHTNKGFFYTLKNLVKNPGKTTKAYLDGNRVKHYKPILLSFVLTGFTVFISYKVLKMGEMINAYFKQLAASNPNSFNPESYNAFLANYSTFFMMLLIPVSGFLTSIVFKKQGHNYYEHVVINAFLYCFWSLFSILIIYPLIFIFNSPISLVVIVGLSFFLFIPFAAWFFKELYAPMSWGKSIWKVIQISLLALLLYIFTSIILGIVAYLDFM